MGRDGGARGRPVDEVDVRHLDERVAQHAVGHHRERGIALVRRFDGEHEHVFVCACRGGTEVDRRHHEGDERDERGAG